MQDAKHLCGPQEAGGDELSHPGFLPWGDPLQGNSIGRLLLEATGDFPIIRKSKHQMKKEWRKFSARAPAHWDAGRCLAPKAPIVVLQAAVEDNAMEVDSGLKAS